MLSEMDTRNKLYDYAERFRQHYQNKDWAAAKFTYFRAQTVAMFMELPEADMIELFGNRAYKDEHEELKDGLFPAAMEEKASWECIRQNTTFNELHLKPASSGISSGIDEFISRDGEIRHVRTY